MTEETVPPHERRLLAAHVVGWDRAQQPGCTLSAAENAQLSRLVARRAAGEPVQHITGTAFFRHETLHVGRGVFVPRPETEVMTGWAIEHLRTLDAPVVVELCAGSGAISRAVATEAPGCRQYAVELSEDALPWLMRNLAGTAVHVVAGDMATALPELDGTVDVVLCNPPYVPLGAWEGLPADVRDFDPPEALFSGEDGMAAMRVLAAAAARLLRPGGLLGAEHGDTQHDEAPAVFLEVGAFDEVRDHVDLTGRWRFVSARRRAVRG